MIKERRSRRNKQTNHIVVGTQTVQSIFRSQQHSSSGGRNETCTCWNVLLVNFKESAPPRENDCICPFSSACFGRKWPGMLRKTINKVWCIGGAGGGRRGRVQRQMCSKGQRTCLRCSIGSHCQPRIRPLCTATD